MPRIQPERSLPQCARAFLKVQTVLLDLIACLYYYQVKVETLVCHTPQCYLINVTCTGGSTGVASALAEDDDGEGDGTGCLAVFLAGWHDNDVTKNMQQSALPGRRRAFPNSKGEREGRSFTAEQRRGRRSKSNPFTAILSNFRRSLRGAGVCLRDNHRAG